MLFPFKSRKKDSEKHLEPTISPIFDESIVEPLPTTEDQDLSLKDFAFRYGMSESQVWRKIKRGELIGRPLNGDLVIASPASLDQKPPTQKASLGPTSTGKKKQREDSRVKVALSPPAPSLSARTPTLRPDAAEATPGDLHLTQPIVTTAAQDSLTPKDRSEVVAGGPVLAKKSTLPPLPASGETDTKDPKNSLSGDIPSPWPISTSTGATANSSTELALLIDHLSLSKDENREILRLAQDSIRKITELSDTLVAMKDAVIEAKTTQIASLKELLALRDKEIKTLQRSNEDLETLARTVSRQAILDQET